MQRSEQERKVLALDTLPLCRIFALSGFSISPSSPGKYEWSPGCAKPRDGDDTPEPYASIAYDLDALVKHRYIRAFYSETSATTGAHDQRRLYEVEVYLIPSDLPSFRSSILPELEQTQKVRRHGSATVCQNALFNLSNIVNTATNRPLIEQIVKTKSLIDAWNDLQPPRVTSEQLERAQPWLQELVKDVQRPDETLDGLMSTLFQYQKQDIAAMLVREFCPQQVSDTTYSAYSDARGRVFYMNSHGDVRLKPGTFTEPRGGILAESPGYGKTLIALSLVVATKNRLPEVETIHTTFGPMHPVPEVVSKRFCLDKNSLLSTCIRKTRMQLSLDALQIERLVYLGVCDVLANTYVQYFCPDTSSIVQPLRRVATRNAPLQKSTADYNLRPVILAKTTLIVVPEMLVAHWEDECASHCQNALADDAIEAEVGPESLKTDLTLEGRLRYRSFVNAEFGKSRLPEAEILARYDILIFSEPYFAKLSHSHAENPLLRMHFMRMIVDEAHFTAGNSRSVALAGLIRTQSRWALSATPTRNLNQFSEKGISQDRVRSAALNNERDEDDVRKLGLICSKYLRMAPFASDERIFTEFIAKPFASQARGFDRLNTVMQQIIIRHRPSEIQHQLNLPPLKTEIVSVKWAYLDRLSYNVMLANFLANSILSERQGQDYLFYDRDTDKEDHKRTKVRRHRLDMLDNLREAHFNLATSDLLNGAEHALSYVEERLSRECSLEERDDLEQVQRALKEATESNLWRLACKEEDIVYNVSNCPKAIASAYDVRNAFLTRESAATRNHKDFLIAGYRIDDIRGAMADARHGEACLQWQTADGLERQIVQAGYDHAESRRQWLNTKPAKAGKSTAPSPSKTEETNDNITMMASVSRKEGRAASARTKTSPKKVSAGNLSLIAGRGSRLKCVPADMPLLQSRITVSSSGKMNWIIDEILASADDDRFIIFGDSAFTLFNVVEGLRVNNIEYSFNVAAPDRKKIRIFQNCRTIKVLLMTPAQGARGLHLTAANRIIFCSPLWRPDDEAQATLRSHRIGQTRSVLVQILVMENSFEEAMLQRRNYLTSVEKTEVTGSKSEADDDQLRKRLEGARFIWARNGERARVKDFKWRSSAPLLGNTEDFPLQNQESRSSSPDSSIGSEMGEPDGPDANYNGETTPPHAVEPTRQVQGIWDPPPKDETDSSDAASPEPTRRPRVAFALQPQFLGATQDDMDDVIPFAEGVPILGKRPTSILIAGQNKKQRLL